MKNKIFSRRFLIVCMVSVFLVALCLPFFVSADSAPSGWIAQSSDTVDGQRIDMLYLGSTSIVIDGVSQSFYQWQFNATNQKYVWVDVTNQSWEDIPVNYVQDFSVFVSQTAQGSGLYNQATSLPVIYFLSGEDVVSFSSTLVLDDSLPQNVYRYDFHIVNNSDNRFVFSHLTLNGSFRAHLSTAISFRVSELTTDTYISVVKDSGSFLSAALGWVGDIGDFILDNPALIVLVVAFVVGGFGVGFLRRIKNS